MAAIDMAAAGFGEAEMNAVQLGKALNDPIKGITALSKSGITFTEQEKELIKTLVESGKTLEAQDMILKAIETQVGGTAEATANASDIMRVGFKQVSEEVGLALLPLFQQLVDFVTTNLLPKIKEFSVFIKENQTLIKNLAIGLGVLVATLGTLSLIIKAVNIAIITFNGIVKIATILQAAFNLVLSLNPIGLVVIAVAALAAGFVLAYQKVEPFRNLIQDVINKIREMGEAIKNSAFGKAIGGIVDRVVGGKAVGGMVSAGQAVRVGEMGSEVFIPRYIGADNSK
jgi:phage-related protein